MDDVTLTLVDLNPKMIEAWLAVFDGEPGVEIVHGSLLDERAGAWVTPTNSRAKMDGGVDGAIRARLGASIQARVRRTVATQWGDFIPVGAATCVETGRASPSWLISTPTMLESAEDISATLNVALATAAALQAVRMQNRRCPGSIRSVAMPGLGAGTGRVALPVCAELMWTAWHLFEHHHFERFDDVRAALELELGDLGPVSTSAPAPQPRALTPRGPRGPVLPRPFHGYGRAIA